MGFCLDIVHEKQLRNVNKNTFCFQTNTIALHILHFYDSGDTLFLYLTKGGRSFI